MHRPVRPVFLISALLVGALGVSAQEISTVSPFMPVGAAAGPATENSPVEFRGMVKSEEGLLFGLFDPVKRRSAWVKLNEAGRDFLVRSFDETSETAVVEYQGRSLTVVMKSPKIESVPVGRMPVVAGAVGPNQGPPPATVNAASQAEEARRLELVTAEVRRRRAARQAATQGQPAPAPAQPVAQPVPQPQRR